MFTRHLNWGCFEPPFPEKGKSFFLCSDKDHRTISYNSISRLFYQKKYSKVFNFDDIWASAVILEDKCGQQTLFTVNPKDMADIAGTTVRSYYRYLRHPEKRFPDQEIQRYLKRRIKDINEYIWTIYDDICERRFMYYNYNHFQEGVICFVNCSGDLHKNLIEEAKKKPKSMCIFGR